MRLPLNISTEVLYTSDEKGDIKIDVESMTAMFNQTIADLTKENHLNVVTDTAFIDWYFSDNDSKLHAMNDIISDIKSSGGKHISIYDFYNTAVYIPQHICIYNNGNTEYNPSDVKLLITSQL